MLPHPRHPHPPGCGPPLRPTWRPTWLASREDIQEWDSRTREERLASSHYWRAKRLNHGIPNGWFHPKALQKVMKAYQDRCAYCGEPAECLEVDHMVPLARGGSNTRENLAPACPACNRRKGTKTALEFLGLEAYQDLIARHPYLND